ncbi:MAG: Asp-tRNA(Asn)/Glu-tRNA(Gln) amidotransferase subunit GatB [Thermodesulfobacteriota bacterium]|nr:Asp-tRNA(Asn)/Glu-tRNA(Gln) amidotransferase subunit GatB [Thermodesulfobacteriota bacterium]
MEFEPVIGLEVHAQLKTDTKIFCGCSTRFGAAPNAHTCPVCTGMPGSLPVLNREVVSFAMKMALATSCQIRQTSRFARKNYFYPDLPKGYQISQYELPIAEHGHIVIDMEAGPKKIGITRIHMEEDAGKLIHDDNRPVSCVDYNRTGVPLIEIVSEPDMRSAAEAGAYLRELRSILRYLEISDGNMEEGSFRCDANVSVRPMGEAALGTRTELKNLNSFKHVEQALAYEIDRHIDIIKDGGAVVQETRLWSPDKSRSVSMRGKEEAHDYRYFPDPDLVPLVIDDQWQQSINDDLPELPAAKRERFVAEYGLSVYDTGVLTTSKSLSGYFEDCAAKAGDAKQSANWIMGELLGFLNAKGQSIEDSPVPAADLGELIRLIKDDVISGKIAKTVFEEMAATGKKPNAIVKEKNLVQVTDAGEIGAAVDAVIAECPDEVEKYKSGKKKVMGFLVGQVMKKTGGKANPKAVNQLLAEKLGEC